MFSQEICLPASDWHVIRWSKEIRSIKCSLEFEMRYIPGMPSFGLPLYLKQQPHHPHNSRKTLPNHLQSYQTTTPMTTTSQRHQQHTIIWREKHSNGWKRKLHKKGMFPFQPCCHFSNNLIKYVPALMGDGWLAVGVIWTGCSVGWLFNYFFSISCLWIFHHPDRKW